MIVSFLSRVGVGEVSSWQQLYTAVTTPLELSSVDRFGAADTRRPGRPRNRPSGPRRLPRRPRRTASGVFPVDFQWERRAVAPAALGQETALAVILVQ